MDCQTVKNSLVAFLDKELSERERLLVEVHIQGCAACAQEKLQLTEAWRLLDRDSPPALSPDFTSSVMARVQAQTRQSSSGGTLGWLGRKGLLWVGGFFFIVVFVMVIIVKNPGRRGEQVPLVGTARTKGTTIEKEPVLPMPAVSAPENNWPVSVSPVRPEGSVVPVLPLVPQVLPSLVRKEIDQDIIANLDLYENAELLQEMDLINDMDVVSSLRGSAS